MFGTIKKPISVLLAFTVAVIPLSCKSLDPKLLEQTAAFDKSITPMRVVINTDSIKACFKGGWRNKLELHAEINKCNQGLRKDWPGIEIDGLIFCCSFQDQESAINILKQNLMFDRDSRTVYLSVLVRKIEWGMNGTWGVIGGLTLGVFVLFGWPGRSDTADIEMEAAVMRPDGRVLKTYTAKVSDTEYSALYYGYQEPIQPAYVIALIAGCADLRKQIEADKENLNKIIR